VFLLRSQFLRISQGEPNPIAALSHILLKESFPVHILTPTVVSTLIRSHFLRQVTSSISPEGRRLSLSLSLSLRPQLPPVQLHPDDDPVQSLPLSLSDL